MARTKRSGVDSPSVEHHVDLPNSPLNADAGHQKGASQIDPTDVPGLGTVTTTRGRTYSVRLECQHWTAPDGSCRHGCKEEA
jgi:hypothetical protein